MKQFLSKIHLFKGLPEKEYDFLEQHSQQKKLEKNDTIFEKGGAPDHLYVLKEGKAKLFDERKITQREEIIQVFSAEDVLDLASLFNQQPYPLSAQALESGEIISFPVSSLRELTDRSQIFLQNAADLLAKTTYELIEGMSDLSLSTTKERLAKYLLKEYHQQKSARSFRLPLNQSQIASHLGTVREIVSRDLASLKKARVIESNQGQIAVLNPEELSHIAEGYSFHA